MLRYQYNFGLFLNHSSIELFLLSILDSSVKLHYNICQAIFFSMVKTCCFELFPVTHLWRQDFAFPKLTLSSLLEVRHNVH